MSDAPLPPECQVPEEYDDRCDWCRKMGGHPHSGCTHNWVREDFDEWSELTKERDAYRADAEAEWHRYGGN